MSKQASARDDPAVISVLLRLIHCFLRGKKKIADKRLWRLRGFGAADFRERVISFGEKMLFWHFRPSSMLLA